MRYAVCEAVEITMVGGEGKPYVKKKIGNFFAATAIAWGYGVLTYLIFFIITSGNLLVSTVLNAIAIIVIVVWDKVESRYAKPKRGDKAEPQKSSFSVKAGLYLFYVVVLISEALLAAEPALPFLSNFADYISSVSYGLLILIAFDAFVGLLFKDTSKQ